MYLMRRTQQSQSHEREKSDETIIFVKLITGKHFVVPNNILAIFSS